MTLGSALDPSPLWSNTDPQVRTRPSVSTEGYDRTGEHSRHLGLSLLQKLGVKGRDPSFKKNKICDRTQKHSQVILVRTPRGRCTIYKLQK